MKPPPALPQVTPAFRQRHCEVRCNACLRFARPPSFLGKGGGREVLCGRAPLGHYVWCIASQSLGGSQKSSTGPNAMLLN